MDSPWPVGVPVYIEHKLYHTAHSGWQLYCDAHIIGLKAESAWSRAILQQLVLFRQFDFLWARRWVAFGVHCVFQEVGLGCGFAFAYAQILGAFVFPLSHVTLCI